jgi:hypothetical protein
MTDEQYAAHLQAQFWKRIRKGVTEDDCWSWDGFKSSGYGQYTSMRDRYQTVLRAHRFSFELHHGPIPKGLDVMHACDNRECANPRHLSVGTRKENLRDMVAKGRHGGPRNWKGEAVNTAKLTAQDALAIRQRGNESRRALAREFGVNRRTILHIINGDTWKHVGGLTA